MARRVSGRAAQCSLGVAAVKRRLAIHLNSDIENLNLFVYEVYSTRCGYERALVLGENDLKIFLMIELSTQ